MQPMAELAGILKNGGLVSRGAWGNHIRRTREKTEAATVSRQKIRQKLKEKIIAAVEKRLPGKKFGIMFSGGVDSSVIALAAKKLKADFICYSVGIEGSRDVS